VNLELYHGGRQGFTAGVLHCLNAQIAEDAEALRAWESAMGYGPATRPVVAVRGMRSLSARPQRLGGLRDRRF
jgi:hypothetical protein